METVVADYLSRVEAIQISTEFNIWELAEAQESDEEQQIREKSE